MLKDTASVPEVKKVPLYLWVNLDTAVISSTSKLALSLSKNWCVWSKSFEDWNNACIISNCYPIYFVEYLQYS